MSRDLTLPGGAGLRLGTSGYSFDDWKGSFYPEGTGRSGMLEHYSTVFDIVEVNSSYYRIFPPRVSESMVSRTPRGFGFIVKLHSSMTHSRDATREQWSAYLDMLKPFSEAGRLECLLAQFPYSFKPDPASVDYVLGLGDRVGEVPLAVETRFDGWYSPRVLERLSGAGLPLVSVDLPRLPHLPPPVAVGGEPFGYVRFHGRNAAKWWEGGPLRYDYTYSDAELASWIPLLDRLGRGTGRVYAMFNNCHFGQAAKDAMRLADMISADEKDEEARR